MDSSWPISRIVWWSSCTVIRPPLRGTTSQNCRSSLTRRVDSLTATSTTSKRRGLVKTPLPRPRHALSIVPSPAWHDSVPKLPLYMHATRRLSDGHVDGVEATWSHEDAIDATLNFGN